MRLSTTTIILFFCILQISAQPFRYAEKIFQHTDTFKNIEYARADWLNNKVTLLQDYNIHNGENKTEIGPVYLDIFTPRGDTLTKRPAVIFAHSGGFLIGSNQNEDMIAFCDSFARRGFVTATLGYRIGMGADITTFLGFPIHLSITEKNASRAVYRAVQDGRAAIRFLKHHAADYGIDTTKIYMVGSSAGAFVALHNLYLNKSDEIPEYAKTSPSLGNIDTVGIQGYGGQANAIVSLWGALEKPELIENEKKPVLLIHGEADEVVPFKKGMPLKTLIPEYDAVDFTIPETYGSFCIDTMLNNRKIEHISYFVPDKKHEFYGVATGNFGEDGPNEYWDTIQLKIADFLFDIFKPTVTFSSETLGLTANFQNTTLGGITSEWDFGDGKFANGAAVSHVFSEPGSYKIKLTSCNENLACDTLTSIISIHPVSVHDKWENTITLYPNPVRDELNISGINSAYRATIFDLMGRVRKIVNASEVKQIDVNNLENGIYLIRIENKGKPIYRKFLKQE